jgi:TolA-binding protein
VTSKKTDSVFNNGRLSKLSRMKQLHERIAEDKKIGQVLTSARAQRKNNIAKKYPLPQLITEESLYTQVLNAYQTRDIDAVAYYTDLFTKRYPTSVFADNAIYLQGNLYLILGLPSEALREFEQVLNEYPMGNKRAAALFGKGVAYRKLNLNNYAERVFVELKKEYPGSPEFFKVDFEEKLLKVQKE